MAHSRWKEILEHDIDTKMKELNERQDGMEEKVQIVQGTLESIMPNITSQFMKLNEKLEKQPEKIGDSRDQRGILGNPNGILGTPIGVESDKRPCSNAFIGNYTLPRADFSSKGVGEEMLTVLHCQSNCRRPEGEFNKLQQMSTVASYQEKFEELMPLILAKNRGLSEEYFVSSF
ncbi:hypothetical protein IFM89_032451 [Coptis chinensis]|uniref:Retrotransposon gag domain-containing protein n=1 Tax=Coptis chinensis TaxID=261450 RepID=A0A835I693_9MAGN|nr:hypothetical protein IFM89_032451 [Coptis chinensis]